MKVKGTNNFLKARLFQKIIRTFAGEKANGSENDINGNARVGMDSFLYFGLPDAHCRLEDVW